MLRTLIHAAEPAEILAGRVEKEHIDLMVGDADLLSLPKRKIPRDLCYAGEISALSAGVPTTCRLNICVALQ